MTSSDNQSDTAPLPDFPLYSQTNRVPDRLLRQSAIETNSDSSAAPPGSLKSGPQAYVANSSAMECLSEGGLRWKGFTSAVDTLRQRFFLPCRLTSTLRPGWMTSVTFQGPVYRSCWSFLPRRSRCLLLSVSRTSTRLCLPTATPADDLSIVALAFARAATRNSCRLSNASRTSRRFCLRRSTKLSSPPSVPVSYVRGTNESNVVRGLRPNRSSKGVM